MGKIINLGILVFSLFLALVLFGCTSVPVCGNGICDAGETNLICSKDCDSNNVELCSDSDDGLDYSVKGLTKGIFFNTTQYTENYDYCILPDEYNSFTPVLVENYCENGYVKDDVRVPCPNGCIDGACVDSNNSELSREIWKNAEPFAITDWNTDGNMIKMILKNNSVEELVFRGIRLDDYGTKSFMDDEYGRPIFNSDLNVSPREVFTVLLPATVCYRDGAPSIMVFQKEEISIIYNSLSIENKKQYGVADMFVDCHLVE